MSELYASRVPVSWRERDDEIDLFELLLKLWRNKQIIIVFTTLLSVIGFCVSFNSEQVWRANALVRQPVQKDIFPLSLIASKSGQINFSGFPSGSQLYDEFILEYNSEINKRRFLKERIGKDGVHLFLGEVDEADFIKRWASKISANNFDFKGVKPGVNLELSFNTRDAALSFLQEYISFIVEMQKRKLVAELEGKKSIQIETLKSALKHLKNDAERELHREVSNTQFNMLVAKAANVVSPLENYDGNGERFPVNLGEKGLQEKLRVLKSMSLESYQPQIVELQVKISRLEQLSFHDINFRPFSYLAEPEAADSRESPKRGLIIMLSMILGFFSGVFFVLCKDMYETRLVHSKVK